MLVHPHAVYTPTYDHDLHTLVLDQAAVFYWNTQNQVRKHGKLRLLALDTCVDQFMLPALIIETFPDVLVGLFHLTSSLLVPELLRFQPAAVFCLLFFCLSLLF